MSHSSEIRIHKKESIGRDKLVYLVYSFPRMEIHEDATRYLSEIAIRCSRNYQRNVAYAISHWLNFCLASEIDYRRASIDEFISYRQAMEGHISEATRLPLSNGTIAQRVLLISGFYEAGKRAGWNLTYLDSINSEEAIRLGPNAQNHHSIGDDTRRYAPRSNRAKTDIRPLSPSELIDVLEALSRRRNGSSSEQQRDRLIAEWMAYCGLRLHEVLGGHAKRGLDVHSISEIVTDPENPFDHFVLRVIGKGGISRNIAVPSWLIVKTQAYISDERQVVLQGKRHQTKQLFINACTSRTYLGKPLSLRRYQAIFERACIKCGLSKVVEKRNSSNESIISVRRPSHSVHDLRHTYAVMTYHAESINGNHEPWKHIQAQMGHAKLATTTDTYLAFVSVHGQWRDIGRASVRELAGL